MTRLHAAEHGAERPVPPAVASFRIKPEAAAKLNAFANSPENVQLLARGKDHAVVGGLKQPPDKLWEKYEWAVHRCGVACEPSHFLVVHSVLRCGLVVGGVS